jgi:hypothetical protein
MNAERVVLRIFCSKRKGAHQIGTVVVDSEGYRLDYVHAAEGVDGPYGHPLSERDAPGATVGATAWCAGCRMRLPMSLDPITLARAGRTSAKLQADGMFADPFGVLRRRRTNKG